MDHAHSGVHLYSDCHLEPEVIIHIDMIDGKRVLHVTMADEEIIAFDHLLNRALNTMLPEAAGPWLELESRIDKFIRNGGQST